MASSDRPFSAHGAWASPRVRRAIERVLRRYGVRAGEAEDLVHDALCKALRTAPAPSDLAGCLALARKTAREVAVDHIRHRLVRRRYDEGPYANPDELPGEMGTGERAAIDERRQLAVLQRQIDRGTITARQAEMLAMAAEGVPHGDIARQFSLAQQTVRNELAMARGTARASWAAYVAAAALVAAVAAVLGWRLQGRAPVAHEIAPDQSTGHPEATPFERAIELRRAALSDCDAERWAECVEGLDHAAALDPDGDRAAGVQAARTRAQERLAPKPHLVAHPDDKR